MPLNPEPDIIKVSSYPTSAFDDPGSMLFHAFRSAFPSGLVELAALPYPSGLVRSLT
jgi:hypothetical protein